MCGMVFFYYCHSTLLEMMNRAMGLQEWSADGRRCYACRNDGHIAAACPFSRDRVSVNPGNIQALKRKLAERESEIKELKLKKMEETEEELFARLEKQVPGGGS